jgi:hypothetical protein
MTQTAFHLWGEILGVAGGALVLLLFGLTLALRQHPAVTSGAEGHRPLEEQEEHEEIRPDGYIDSFAGVIEEAGGKLPPVVQLALPAIILWWLIYLILNWTP